MAGSGKGPLRIAIEDFFSTFKLGETLHDWYSQLFEKFEEDLISTNRELFEYLANIPEIEQYLHIKPILSRTPGHQVGLAVLTAVVIGATMGLVGTALQVIAKGFGYRINQKFPTQRFDPSTSIAVMARNTGLINDLRNGLKDLGWSDQDISLLDNLIKQRVDENIVVTMWLRGEITEMQLDTELKIRNWSPIDIQWLKKSRQVIPTPQDLITLQVREAWNDEIAARFQYDAGDTSKVSEWAKKQGLDPDWIKRYWRAHWTLPGVQQAYEMLHRLRPGETQTPFTLDDMRALLQTADYPPFWRDRLIATSYSPYTRVDVRRMYKMGILTEKQVYAAYRDIGYDEAHAQNLTKFTVQYETATDDLKPDLVAAQLKTVVLDQYKRKLIDRGTAANMLTGVKLDPDYVEALLKMAELDRKGDLIPDVEKQNIGNMQKLVDAAYVEGLISREQAQGALTKLGIPADTANVLLDNDDYEYQHAVLTDNLKALGKGYVNGSFTYNETVSALGRLNVTGKQQDNLFSDWNAQKNTPSNRASEAQFRAAFKSGWITDLDYKQALVDLGYCAKDVTMMYNLYTQPSPVTPEGG